MSSVGPNVQIPHLRWNLERVWRCTPEALPDCRATARLLGTSPAMQEVWGIVEKVSDRSCPVLIVGETGTCEGIVARAVHSSGAWRDGPFVPIDYSALTAASVRSAASGTLFLDEIGDLPLEIQAKLLQVLRESEGRRFNPNKAGSLAARVIAATDCQLEVAVRERRFREDLYFRLNVVQIRLPALRERKSDIPLLVNHFVEMFASSGATIRTVSDDAMAHLIAYDWPGNVRELENVIERVAIFSSRN